MCRVYTTQKVMCEEGGLKSKCAAKKGVFVSECAPGQCSLKYRIGRAPVMSGMKPGMVAHA